MIPYLIKSTACLLIFYGFFYFFLRPYKILIFNRFYLITSLIFSLIIPLIIIPVESDFTITASIDKFTLSMGQTIQGKEISRIPVYTAPQITYQDILPIPFIIISSILLIRYATNIFRIIRNIIKYKRIRSGNIILVLVEEKVLPYSFFKYVDF